MLVHCGLVPFFRLCSGLLQFFGSSFRLVGLFGYKNLASCAPDSLHLMGGRGGGLLPKNLGGVVHPAPRNPYPFPDQNM